MRYRDIAHSQREDLSAMLVCSYILCRPTPHLPFQSTHKTQAPPRLSTTPS